MEPVSITIAYIVNSDAYRELSMSIEYMRNFPGLKHIVVLNTAGEETPPGDKVVQYVSHNFGRGMDKQPEDGGIDEVAARNYMRELAIGCGTEWWMFLDADEVMQHEAWSEIAKAHAYNYVAAWSSRINLRSPELHVHEHPPIRMRDIGPMLVDPQLRMFTSQLGAHFVPMPAEVVGHLSNRTLHTSIVPTMPEVYLHERTWKCEQPYLLHFRHFLEPRRSEDGYCHNNRVGRWHISNVPSGVKIPEQYLIAWNSQCEAKGAIRLS